MKNASCSMPGLNSPWQFAGSARPCHLSQKELGLKLKTSQPRVAKIERAATDVSLDQLVRAFAAAGGRIVVKVAAAKAKKGKSAKTAVARHFDRRGVRIEINVRLSDYSRACLMPLPPARCLANHSFHSNMTRFPPRR